MFEIAWLVKFLCACNFRCGRIRIRSCGTFTSICIARYAERGVVVCLSVCLSVTLRYRDHIGWNSSKIISRLVRLRCTQQTPTSRVYSKETPRNFGQNKGTTAGKAKSVFRRTKVLILISDTGQDNMVNRKSHMRFRVVSKSTAPLDDLLGPLCTLFQNTCP